MSYVCDYFKDVVSPTLSLAQDRMSLFRLLQISRKWQKIYLYISRGKKNHWLSLKNKGTPLWERGMVFKYGHFSFTTGILKPCPFLNMLSVPQYSSKQTKENYLLDKNTKKSKPIPTQISQYPFFKLRDVYLWALEV